MSALPPKADMRSAPNIVIFKFCDDEEMADETEACTVRTGPPREEP